MYSPQFRTMQVHLDLHISKGRRYPWTIVAHTTTGTKTHTKLYLGSTPHVLVINGVHGIGVSWSEWVVFAFVAPFIALFIFDPDEVPMGHSTHHAWGQPPRTRACCTRMSGQLSGSDPNVAVQVPQMATGRLIPWSIVPAQVLPSLPIASASSGYGPIFLCP
jgi:hypothetical protein